MSKTPGTKKTTKKPANTKAAKPKASKPKATREHIVAQAQADQENAARRDERAASADGMIASERAMTESEPAAKGGKKKTKAAIKPKQPKPLSRIDAAAQVLGGSKEPMACRAIVDEVTAKKLWAPRSGGKTPHATLYSAILREINTKGKDARFKKVDRGQFILSKKA